MYIVFKTMLAGIFRDKHTLVLTIIFPVGLMIGLGLYHQSTPYSERLLAGVLSMQILLGSSMVTAFHVMAQRNRGIYKLLRVTPFSTASFIGAMTASRTVLSTLVCCCIIVASIIILNVSMSLAAWLLIIIILGVGSLCFTAVGFIAANLSRDESNVNMISNLIGFPMLFLSEAFYSLQGAPEWIQLLSKVNPFTYLVQAIRNAMDQTGAASTIWVPLAILSGFTILLLALAVITFRWDSEHTSRRSLRSHRSSSSM